MHKACAYGPNEMRAALNLLDSKRYKHSSPGLVSTNGDVPRLLLRMQHIGCNPRRCKQVLDFLTANTMLATFGPVPIIPFKARKLHGEMIHFCVDICMVISFGFHSDAFRSTAPDEGAPAVSPVLNGGDLPGPGTVVWQYCFLSRLPRQGCLNRTSPRPVNH